MIEKEEKLTLEEQRINELLTEGFDRTKYPELKPDYIPPEMFENCVTIEKFAEHGRNLITQKLKKLYGING